MRAKFNRLAYLPVLVLPALCFVTGCGTPSFLVTPVSNTNKITEEEVMPGKGFGRGDKIVIVEVEGMLINARAGGFLQPTENKVSLFTQQLRKAAEDDSVKAVVLRVNSPGGTVTATDTMYEILKEFREETGKPVVASIQEVAASGGYYVSCGADEIVAQPTSVVGSIGVIFNAVEFSGAMRKLGITAEAIKSGPLKDMGSPFKALAKEEKDVMQGMVDEYYGRFVNVVTSNRPVVTGDERVKLATDGRVFSGQNAAALGLVDRLGRLEDAIDRAKELGKAKNAKVVLYRRPYGYGGSIYASTAAPAPLAAGGADVTILQLDVPNTRATLPGGFYYLWEPGL